MAVRVAGEQALVAEVLVALAVAVEMVEHVGDLAQAARRIVRAMIDYPEMVGGTRRFDTDLIRAARGKLISKVGAEAVYYGLAPAWHP